jgi:hypothetical protein
MIETDRALDFRLESEPEMVQRACRARLPATTAELDDFSCHRQ